MIHFFTHADLDRYMVNGDPLSRHLGHPDAKGRVVEGWLAESPVRRMIAWHVYGDLLVSAGRRILDVGGGHSSLTYALRDRHDYRVVELGAHDPPPDGMAQDWRDVNFDADLVISVDLFPNVDQGLQPFLRRRAGIETRLVLTTYPERHYRVKRMDADEVMTLQAWTWEQTERALGRYATPPSESLFANGRQVCMVTLP